MPTEFLYHRTGHIAMLHNDGSSKAMKAIALLEGKIDEFKHGEHEDLSIDDRVRFSWKLFCVEILHMQEILSSINNDVILLRLHYLHTYVPCGDDAKVQAQLNAQHSLTMGIHTFLWRPMEILLGIESVRPETKGPYKQLQDIIIKKRDQQLCLEFYWLDWLLGRAEKHHPLSSLRPSWELLNLQYLRPKQLAIIHWRRNNAFGHSLGWVVGIEQPSQSEIQVWVQQVRSEVPMLEDPNRVFPEDQIIYHRKYHLLQEEVELNTEVEFLSFRLAQLVSKRSGENRSVMELVFTQSNIFLSKCMLMQCMHNVNNDNNTPYGLLTLFRESNAVTEKAHVKRLFEALASKMQSTIVQKKMIHTDSHYADVYGPNDWTRENLAFKKIVDTYSGLVEDTDEVLTERAWRQGASYGWNNNPEGQMLAACISVAASDLKLFIDFEARNLISQQVIEIHDYLSQKVDCLSRGKHLNLKEQANAKAQIQLKRVQSQTEARAQVLRARLQVQAKEKAQVQRASVQLLLNEKAEVQRLRAEQAQTKAQVHRALVVREQALRVQKDAKIEQERQFKQGQVRRQEQARVMQVQAQERVEKDRLQAQLQAERDRVQKQTKQAQSLLHEERVRKVKQAHAVLQAQMLEDRAREREQVQSKVHAQVQRVRQRTKEQSQARAKTQVQRKHAMALAQQEQEQVQAQELWNLQQDVRYMLSLVFEILDTTVIKELAGPEQSVQSIVMYDSIHAQIASLMIQVPEAHKQVLLCEFIALFMITRLLQLCRIKETVASKRLIGLFEDLTHAKADQCHQQKITLTSGMDRIKNYSEKKQERMKELARNQRETGSGQTEFVKMVKDTMMAVFGGVDVEINSILAQRGHVPPTRLHAHAQAQSIHDILADVIEQIPYDGVSQIIALYMAMRLLILAKTDEDTESDKLISQFAISLQVRLNQF